MDNKKEQERILELKNIINQSNYNYHVIDSPTINDYDYDMFLHELEALEFAFPQFSTDDSPTQRVGGMSDNTFKKVPHVVQMGSLQDVFSTDEVRVFDNRVRQSIPRPVYVVEPKIDGLSVSLEYTNGVLTRGSTRGDGFIGEDVTQNIKTIKSIPLKLKTSLPFLEVRGEVYMPRKIFEKNVKLQIDNGEEAFKNPRNAAAGSLRQKSSKITAQRKLDVFIFNIQQIEGITHNSHSEGLDFLKELGFKVSPSYPSYTDIQDVIHEINKIGEHRYEYEFDIDGAVVKVNSLEDRATLGATSKFPKWAVAYKYPPEEKETTLLEIQINVGRTGALTPTAVFEPIELAGTTVSRAVLHNQDFIDEKDIRLGDTILVRKAGEIIPEVLSSVMHKEGSVPFKIPSECPSCGENIIKEDEQAVLRCINPLCPSTVYRNIIHFASRNAMNIDGLGPAIVQALIDTENIRNSSDLYFLNRDELVNIDRLGEKSIDNLLSAITNSKENMLSKFIFGLGIRNIGQKAAEIVCGKFDTLDKLRHASYDELMLIDGFGEIMATSIVQYFNNEDTITLLNKFELAGLKLIETKNSVSNQLEGLTFVITGTLPSMSRDEAADLIKRNGGTVSSSVSKKTSYLLAGENAGSKLVKATELNIRIATQTELEDMIV